MAGARCRLRRGDAAIIMAGPMSGLCSRGTMPCGGCPTFRGSTATPSISPSISTTPSYDPARSDNEARSADLLVTCSGSGLGRDGIRSAVAMIRATAAHGPSEDPETRLMLDLDLAVLGAPRAIYDAYAAAVPAGICDGPRRGLEDRARGRARSVSRPAPSLPDRAFPRPAWRVPPVPNLADEGGGASGRRVTRSGAAEKPVGPAT